MPALVLAALLLAPPREGLLSAEHAFAADAVRRGTRAAFLAVLHPAGVLFRPGPVHGPTAVAARPEDGSELRWAPARAEAAASGDLGWTTGPYTYRAAPGGPVSHGWFVSLWEREGRGPWRLRWDLGTPQPGPDGTRPLPDPGLRAEGRVPPPGETSSLRRLEEETSREAGRIGFRAALQAHAAADLRIHRAGHPPSEALTLVPEGASSWALDEVRVAASGELGATRGIRQAEGRPAAAFVRFWRREGGTWRLVLDVESPLRP